MTDPTMTPQQLTRRMRILSQTRGWGHSPVPLPPGDHLVDADEEAGKQVPEAVEEAGDDAAKGQVRRDVHRHHSIESVHGTAWSVAWPKIG